MMHYVPLLCLLCFFAHPSLQTGNEDLDEVIEEIMFLMSEETDGMSSDHKYDYSLDPDLFVPPSTTFQQSLEVDVVKDVNGVYGYNPFKVLETRTVSFQDEITTMNGAAVTNYILQAIAESSGSHLNYHITVDDSAASMMFYDVTFPSFVEAYPALFSISVANDFCGSAPANDSEVEVQYIVAVDKLSCLEPELQITKEMFLNQAENSSACRAFEGSTCDCYEPDIVTSTSGFSESGQYGKPTVQRPDMSSEVWFSKLEPYYQMLMEMYTSYDVVISQIHQSLEAVSAAPFCCFNDIWYQYGDIITVPDDPCLHCICDEHWNGTDSCTVLTCPLDDYVADTGDTSVDVIAMPGSCCGLPKSIVIGDLCFNNPVCQPGGSCVSSVGDFSCNCFPGYQPTGDGKGCEDIDECVATPNVCTNGVCTNTVGSFNCDCDDGFISGGPEGCEDRDECTDGTDTSSCQAPAGSCQNVVGTWVCSCAPHYENPDADDQTCVDVDECSDGDVDKSACEAMGGMCVNNIGAPWTCDCADYYENPPADNQACQDIDECTNGIADTSLCEAGKGVCVNNVGAPFSCSCLPGFENAPGSIQQCVDIDECGTAASASCAGGTGSCVNVESTWFCNCTSGYHNPAGDDQTCVDQDDCVDPNIDKSSCVNGDCVNVVGAPWTCACESNYDNPDGNTQTCVDVDECSDPDAAVTSCETGNGACTNNEGAPWTCTCDPNYENPVGDDQTCVDVNECTDGTDTSSCEAGKGTCNNEVGAPWTCTCEEGYEQDAGNPQVCVDINECTDPNQDTSSCQAGTGSCTNTVGSWVCTCNGNYLNPNDDDQTCVDNDECSDPNVDISSCDAAAGSCHNVEGGWACICQPNFENPPGDNHTCVDIDECSDPDIDTSGCDGGNGECTNHIGAPWTCTCDENYENVPGDDQSCQDINECVAQDVDTSACTDNNGNCVNQVGAPWTCNCDPNYENPPGDDQTCIDVDECSDVGVDKSACASGTCVNNLGAPWTCDCDEHFENPVGDDQSCVDVDECTDDGVDKSSCVAGEGDCTNNAGAPWTCTCVGGYENPPGDDQTCVDIDECTDDGVDKSSCVAGEGDCTNNVGAPWTCTCVGGYENLPDDDQTCVDIDECTDPDSDTSSCLESFGSCTNEIGGWSCTCLSGFELDPQDPEDRTCIDIDECARFSITCGLNGACVNFNGTYICDCNEFFEPVNDTCIPLDMCKAPGPCAGTSVCIDGPQDLYICQCLNNQTYDVILGDCVNVPVVDAIINRTYTDPNNTDLIIITNNTILNLQTDVADCFMYFEISFPDFDMSLWHPDWDNCTSEGTVRQEPYISVHDEFLHPDNDIRYCRQVDNNTIITYFNKVIIRTANAGQNKFEFPILVKLYKGEGACCGGTLIPVAENKNPFNQIDITSANYPAPYDNNQWCSWVIERPPGTSGGSIIAYIIDFSVVVTAEDESTLNCSVEDSLYISNTRSMVDSVEMCGSFPEWGNFYQPEQMFIHWQTNEERVTRGFQIMYFFTNNIYGITTFERSLTTVCGLVKIEEERHRRGYEDFDEDDDYEEEAEDAASAIHVPLGLKLPRFLKKVKRVSAKGGSSARFGETPFLVVIPVFRKPDLSVTPEKIFFGVLIAENFVVTTSQVKDFQEADKKNRKIKLRFGVYDMLNINIADFIVGKSALKVYKNPECIASLAKEPVPLVDGMTSWEYTDSVLGGCPMLMVTGELPTNDVIQPAMFPWYTFPWRSNDKRVERDSKRLFHVGWDSNEAGTDVKTGVSNIPKKVTMQKTSDLNCLEPLGVTSIAPQRLCALATKGKGPTQGDIGSPVLKRMYVDNPEFTREDEEIIGRHWVVIGILVKAQIGTSVPNDGQSFTTYQAYIEVNSYLHWMQKIMNERKLVNCRRPMSQGALDSGP